MAVQVYSIERRLPMIQIRSNFGSAPELRVALDLRSVKYVEIQ